MLDTQAMIERLIICSDWKQCVYFNLTGIRLPRETEQSLRMQAKLAVKLYVALSQHYGATNNSELSIVSN